MEKVFDFDEIPDGVGFETDKGIFTYGRDDDVFRNRKDDIYLEMDGAFDSALTFAVRYGSVEKAIEAIDSGFEIYADKKARDFLANAENWTLVFDVHDDGTEILRGEEAKKAILDRITKQKEFDARFEAIRNVDLTVKPKTNGDKLRQFCKKVASQRPRITLDYMVGGVELFLLDSPNVKLEQMTKLIDSVAPEAVYNSDSHKYSDRVKSAVKNDKKFQAKLAAAKKSITTKGR